MTATRGPREAAGQYTGTTIRPRVIGGYALPNIQYNSDDGRRFVHADLADMRGREVFAERQRVLRSLTVAITTRSRYMLESPNPPYLVPAIDWLQERLDAIDAEIARRRRSR